MKRRNATPAFRRPSLDYSPAQLARHAAIGVEITTLARNADGTAHRFAPRRDAADPIRGHELDRAARVVDAAMINPDAAPDLYAALKLVRHAFATAHEKSVNYSTSPVARAVGEEILRRADVALALAEQPTTLEPGDPGRLPTEPQTRDPYMSGVVWFWVLISVFMLALVIFAALR